MLFSILLSVFLMILFLFWMRRDHFAHLPGPSLWQLIWKYDTDAYKSHLLLSELKEKYGPMFRLPRFGEDPMLVLGDYESIHHVLVKEGKQFGGRPNNFRLTSMLAQTGVLQNSDPDETWKVLRKTTHRHLRQFGDGMSRLEAIISDMSEDMFSKFTEKAGEPYNPKRVVIDAAANVTAFLLMGKRCRAGDEIVEKMQEYQALFLRIIAARAPLQMKILDVFPWMRHFGFTSGKVIQRALELELEIWQRIRIFSENNPDIDSIYTVLIEQISEGNSQITEKDAIKTISSLVLAGVATTSTVLYAAINILAHHVDIQDKIYTEIQTIVEKTGRDPGLQNKSDMHYCRAVLLETLRYTDSAPLGALHRNREESKLQGHTIPADMLIVIAHWNLHKDERFWGDPFAFRPDRFLDEDGHLIPPDHPNRKHLMPFGAGTRVCLGETLALTRLFIWLVNTVQRFKILPAPGNQPSSIDVRQFKFVAVLEPTPYEVIFNKRDLE